MKTITAENTVDLEITEEKEETGECKKAFNLHNGLMLEEQLNQFTHDDFVLQKEDDYQNFAYMNSKEELVIVDFEGNVFTNIYLPAIFQSRAKKRLNKTNNMLTQYSGLKQFG